MRPDLPALVDKPTRLLATGAVRLVTVSGRDVVVADVAGDTGHRTVIRNLSRGWSCTCPSWAYRRGCAHVDAVALVVPPPTAPSTGDDER